jgi:hypothetical protein
MPKLSKTHASSTRRILLYGPPKSGKTQLAGALASDYDLVWFDLENGHNTLYKLPQSAQERIQLISIPDTRSFPIAIETCLKVIKGVQLSICSEHGKVDCPMCKKSGAEFDTVHLSALPQSSIVVFDSLTQLTNSAIAHITKGQPDEYKLQTDDWGNLGKLMDVFLSHVQQAGFNVICISHETDAEMEDGKMKIVPVAGTRNFSRNAAKYFDDVIYCEVKNRKHVAASSTTYAIKTLTGSRSAIALENLDPPSLLPLFQTSPASQSQISQFQTSQGEQSQPQSQDTPAQAAVSALNRLKLKINK